MIMKKRNLLISLIIFCLLMMLIACREKSSRTTLSVETPDHATLDETVLSYQDKADSPDPMETPIRSFDAEETMTYQSGWVKMSDPHYGIRFAVPCFWHVDMPDEKYRGLSYSIRNYSYEYSASFPRNDEDFWESGGIKIDMAFPQKAHRGTSMEDYVANLYVHAEADGFELVSTEVVLVNGQKALLVTTKSVFGIGHFYLFDLNEDAFLVYSLSPGAIDNPDVQTILHSLAIDPDIRVEMPDSPPGYPLEGQNHFNCGCPSFGYHQKLQQNRCIEIRQNGRNGNLC